MNTNNKIQAINDAKAILGPEKVEALRFEGWRIADFFGYNEASITAIDIADSYCMGYKNGAQWQKEQIKTVYILSIDKKSLVDGSEYKSYKVQVGTNTAALIKYLQYTHLIDCESDLIKNEKDHFPYFSDGGFKYTFTTSDWNFTFTCYPEKLYY